jgi:SPP1 gp7 family putative phage head morphogenesis protein
MAINANTELYDKIIDRAAMIRLYERRVSNKVELVLDGHEVKIDTLIKGAEKSSKGFLQLREAIDQQLQTSYKEVFSVSRRSLLDLFADQASFAYQNVESVMGRIWKTQRPSRRIAEEVVLQQPLYNNQTLAQGWSSVSSSERQRLEAVIRKGIADGLTPDEIALNVRRGNVHSISRNQAKALTITSITSVYAQADHSIYEANEKALLGWQYVAVLDSRTTPLCAHRDGSIYEISDKSKLPPAHYRCRSTTVPVFRSWSDMATLEGAANVRRRNLSNLSDEQKKFYDGQTPLRESYNDWLKRQSQAVQLRHLGDYQKVDMLNSGRLTVDRFSNPEGNNIGIRELRKLTDTEYTVPGDTKRFANAKAKLDAMQLGATSPEDLYDMRKTLVDYYLLQAGELDGTLSATNFRGTLMHTKQSTRRRVLSSPPTEEQLKYNPVTGRYEDVRLYQPNPDVYAASLRRVTDSKDLKDIDKDFINKTLTDLDGKMGLNERAVIADNLRIVLGRYRSNPEPWVNFKAVVQGQIKFDVMNVSDSIETQIRKDSDILKKLAQDNYIDPVLGVTQLDDLEKNFISNIFAKNKWEDSTAPKLARELRGFMDLKIPAKIRSRIADRDIEGFYQRFAYRLGMGDSPDRDQFAVQLGRDLYNTANLNGDRKQWYELGMNLLADKENKLFQIETYGVQKRRMRSRLSGSYFGPYYDTVSYTIRVTDPRIQEYAKLTRKVDIGLRVAVVNESNRLLVKEGYKTYFLNRGLLGQYDTRIPITSTNSFSDFPEELVDKSLTNALNWAGQAKYKIDPDFYDFTKKLLYFKDDRGKSALYDDLNHYRKYIVSRGDAYERFKSMDWLRASERTFSNHPFVDHRARVYDRGFISPQSGESFRPFLSTELEKPLGVEGYGALTDQIGSFLGGLNDFFEAKYDGLTFLGRQAIAEKWRPEMVNIGNAMRRSRPADIRYILENELVANVEGEELGKFYRFAIELAKIDEHIAGGGTLDTFKTALAMEQDASSSGAQIIALTTKNKQLAELSNVVPTTQKKRLYDEIAAATYNDPRFKVLNEKLGLRLKDLQKAAKAQNMVTFYGAGERTGILNVEGKLAKVLGKDKSTLVVTASDRETVLNEISARVARYEKYDPDTAAELKALRSDVRDIFNKGQDPGDEIMEQLYFLDPKTKDLVEKLSNNYDKVVTPADFKQIANIMSEHLAEQVPILKDFTKFFGRLAQDFLTNAKPSNSAVDWKTLAEITFRGPRKKGYVLPDAMSEILGLPKGQAVSEQLLKRLPFWNPGDDLADLVLGAKAPTDRKLGKKLYSKDIILPTLDIQLKNNALKVDFFKSKTLVKITVGEAGKNKLPKSWARVPWVNFDGKIIEQGFTQVFEERLRYKDKDGNWMTNILMVPQKTEASWWDQTLNKEGAINDIADATRARTAFAVNGNHSNDAVIVKKFHLWGRENNVATSTIHDAFFTNIADLMPGRNALRGIYAETLKSNVVKSTLDEMLARGLPKEIYDAYMEEAIQKGLIPVVGKSRVGDKILTKDDILTTDDVLQKVPSGFKTNYGWYGVG